MRPRLTNQTLKVLGLLLAYPCEQVVAARETLMEALRAEAWLSEGGLENIETLLKEQAHADILDLQEDYVSLFDRTPSLSLHLFEHVHGDSRDRGQAMVELDALYREKGLENVCEHTPDYLPMFLECLSVLPIEEAREYLASVIDITAAIGERLRKRKSSYVAVFDALLEASARIPDASKLEKALALASGEALTQDQMDKAWEEQFAFDQTAEANNQSGCPKANEMLARMGLPEDKKGARS